MESEINSAPELVVILMATDPNPREFIRRRKITDNAVMVANARGIQTSMKRFELNGRMEWIFQPERIIFVGQFLNGLWQLMKLFPES